MDRRGPSKPFLLCRLTFVAFSAFQQSSSARSLSKNYILTIMPLSSFYSWHSPKCCSSSLYLSSSLSASLLKHGSKHCCKASKSRILWATMTHVAAHIPLVWGRCAEAYWTLSSVLFQKGTSSLWRLKWPIWDLFGDLPPFCNSSRFTVEAY